MNQAPGFINTVPTDLLYAISRLVTQSPEWKPALDEITRLVRVYLIYDNVAVYIGDPTHQNVDVAYARATGRGRSAEADVAWGENLAGSVALSAEPILQEPENDTNRNRLERPFILGLPLRIGQKSHGAILLIRFGGPPFSQDNIRLAEFIASQIALLVERQKIREDYTNLEKQHQQSRLQQDFISTISHELRSPLGFIKGYTTTLLRSDTTWDQKTQEEFLTIIDQETDRLQQLIDNLLDSARLQAGELPILFQHVRLDSVLNDIILRSRLHHPSLHLTLEMESPISPIRADPQRLAQVFENLISNAVKYAPGSPIKISITQNEETVKIDFKDQGPGISPIYLPYIFDRFFRSPDSPNIHGSGLGLYICKQIIRAHKGEISANSTVGVGTIISITLPREEASSREGKQEANQ